jgi:hypothetical protein
MFALNLIGGAVLLGLLFWGLKSAFEHFGVLPGDEDE